MRPDFRASSTISGPIPAQSPSVMPMRGFIVLLLMLVIVIELFNRARARLRARARAGVNQTLNVQLPSIASGRPTLIDQLKRLDEGLLAQAGDPAFLNLLRFLLDQFFLDIRPHLVE